MSDEKNKLVVHTTEGERHWMLLQRQCQAFLESDFLPKHVDTLAKALTIALKGKELGIPPLQAFSSISVINGKPCLSAELMLALVYQKIPGAKVTLTTPLDKQNTEATLEAQRPGGTPQLFRFTIEDAKRAGLVQPRTPWEKFPAAMLRSRVISAACRAVFPDALSGCCYTSEELGGEAIDVEEIQSTPVKPVKAQEAQLAAAREHADDLCDLAVALDRKAEGSKPVPWEDVKKELGLPTPAFSPLPFEKPEASPKQQSNGSINEWPKAKPGWEKDKCTEAQLRRLHVIGKERGYDHAKIHDLVVSRFKKGSTAELTKSEIQDLFLELERPAAAK